MTEQAQTTDTEFRIDTLIRREADPQDETTERGIFRAAQIIAAEIDRLQRELAEARAELDLVKFAAHMPADYIDGLPAWVNQHLYAAYIGARQSPEVLRAIAEGRLTFPDSPVAKELAEARAYISTIIDAPGDYPAEGSA